MSAQTIPEALGGVVRIRDMSVAPDNHHYIVLSLLHDWMRDVAAPAARGVLLDFGCGGQPYRALFEPLVSRYIGADVAPAAGVALDVSFIPGERLLLPDASVDTVLSTQVLEHVVDPSFYLRECRRLLEPSGRLIITVPMQWRHHEVPYDYLRFTRYGIVSLLENAGFEVDVAQPCGGAFALIGQILANALAEQGTKSKMLFRLVNHFALTLDRRFPDHDDTLLWMCIARLVEVVSSDGGPRDAE